MSHSPYAPLEAVFLFQGDQILREMLYPEFEAILDGFIPIPDYINSSAKAVYVQLNHQLCVTGAVFFLLGFDEKGIVDRRWNVPLQQLLASAGPGPDMGAGQIRLACFSQCSVAWHQKNLWDPQMATGKNSFVAIRRAAKDNRFGFVVKPEAAPAPTPEVAEGDIPTLKPLSLEDFEREQHAIQQQLHEAYNKELREKVSLLTKEQRLRMATLTSEQQDRLQALQHEHQQRLEFYQEKLELLERSNVDLEERNRGLKDNLDSQASKIEGIREYFDLKLKSAQQGESSQLQALQANYELELEVKIQAATSQLREMLEMREVELFYRHQNESALKEEIVTLKHENQALIKNGGDQLLSRLAKAGISFISFQPGVGQLSIPVDDLARYLENTPAYIAEKSGVSESLYISWWAHYQNPCCHASDPKGQSCGRRVARIESPLEFHPGESDRCDQHKTVKLHRIAERR
jgi:hypothetical protein